ncbi:hypothetical protein L0636_04710 [Halomonas janggokensis]|uniref:Tetracyclin repressor-like C-terminal domain-containing protein n=1 Tax=Vreelandella janggokensis TaxID=370767 RepID=A0ABT4IU86_9GAMM|nr:hypothetical protein [Halomonas janggokensis]MCZ0927213.1 hypothetical protein [Halomonas janggokensis]MCZ0929721.1 hypothetical protein [Halomonas janggokensis]
MLEALDAYRSQRQRDMADVLAMAPARAGIEAFFRMVVEDIRDPAQGSGCMSINHAVEMAPHDDEIRRRTESDFQSIEQALTSAIRRGKEDGSVTSSRSSVDLAKLLIVTFSGLQVLTRSGIDRTRVDEGLSLVLTLLD